MLQYLFIFGVIYLVNAQGLKEGSSCTNVGVQGTCRKARVCPSVGLHVDDSGVICSTDGTDPVVCCTDCYIDDISKATVTLDGIVWKTGGVRKSYDKCVEYASTLPYACKSNGVSLAVNKKYDEASGCHRLQVIVKQGPAAISPKQRVDFPHLALLGYGSTLETAHGWNCQGSIISERFVITSALCGKDIFRPDLTAFVAVGINKRSDNQSKWQKLRVKRFILHPEYNHRYRLHAIGLIETETDIKFGVNVLPICLADQPAASESAQVGILSTDNAKANVKTLIKRLSKEDCPNPKFQNIVNENVAANSTQACYTHYNEDASSCRGSNGRPIYISGELKCMDYAVGLVSYGTPCDQKDGTTVYTLFLSYLPWIEATVWP